LIKKFFITTIILVLSFTKSYSETITDFEIERFSIGQSLLKTFSKQEIMNFFNYDNLPSSMKFRIAEIYNQKEIDMEIYEAMQFYYKPEDENFILHGLNGFFFCKSKDYCSNMFKQILSDLKDSYPNYSFYEWEDMHPDDRSGESIVKGVTFNISGGSIIVRFNDWSDKMKYRDNVGVEINTKEVSSWIRNNFF